MKAKKQIEAERNQREVRLNRALEEIEKYKITIKESNITDKDQLMNQQMKKENEKLSNELKKIEKHKNELLNVVKKQMKLIDVLKRQKIHLEASRKLSFTEEGLCSLY